MKLCWSILLILSMFIIYGCNLEDSEIGSSIDENYTISFYGARKNGSGDFVRSDNPIFIETDIMGVDFIDGDVRSFKIYFTKEYLSKFDSETIIEEYEKKIHVDGLRIYTSNEWDMFELQINGETQFYGYFPMGKASSFYGPGPHMSHDIDGVTLIMNLLSQDILGIDENDEKKLYEVFSALDLIQD
ncbi:hypothetical protein RBH29_17505 [Herbivorax sp. ANBcel31]|uniref:hypothetical protein n=1 Tax=Herbivorax sp. ANBcel31 TaxID=3069754 RepID=UPI0027B71F7E|nr:hypothetical protein [Herbivorax sp. ANBcel31]MDQ2088223.1 hypothetical protein [Herbivorax sp. ANBcel31]